MKRMILLSWLLIVVGLAILGFQNPTQAVTQEVVVLSEDFNVNLGPFQPVSGLWTVANGKVSVDDVNDTENYLVASGIGLDVNILATLNIVDDSSGIRIGVGAHAAGGTGDWLVIVSRSGNYHSLEILESRVAFRATQPMANITGANMIPSGVPFNLRVVTQGLTVKARLWLVGTPEPTSGWHVEATMSSLNQNVNGVTLYNFIGASIFDSIVVTKTIELSDSDLFILDKIDALDVRVEALEAGGVGGGLSAEEVQDMIDTSLAPVLQAVGNLESDISTIISAYNTHTHDKGSGGRNTSGPNPQISSE